MDIDTLFFKRLLSEGRNLAILGGQNPVNHFDDGHVDADIIVKTGEFNTNRARPDDQHAGRLLARHQGVFVGPDGFAISLDPRQGPRPRATGQDDMGGGQIGDGLIAGRDFHLAARAGGTVRGHCR